MLAFSEWRAQCFELQGTPMSLLDCASSEVRRRIHVARLTGFRDIDRVIRNSKDEDLVAAWQEAANMLLQQQDFNMDFEQRIKALESKVRQLQR
jgi:hypothetical protein